MAILKWDDLECCWECSECGARYSAEEVARCFNYCSNQVKASFVEGYCMDCGQHFETCED